MTVRRATAVDVAALAALRGAWVEEDGGRLLEAAIGTARERRYARLVLSPSDRARP